MDIEEGVAIGGGVVMWKGRGYIKGAWLCGGELGSIVGAWLYGERGYAVGAWLWEGAWLNGRGVVIGGGLVTWRCVAIGGGVVI